MTKTVTRALAVNCLLDRIQRQFGEPLTCTVCGEPILPDQAIQFDHIHSDVFGGAHEYQNLRPIHYDPCHKKKTKADVQAKAKSDRILGLTCTKPSKKIASKPFDRKRTRKFNGQVVPRTPVQSST